jgi:hypothetical protein
LPNSSAFKILNKKVKKMQKDIKNTKQAYALLIAVFLLGVFAILSISIIENNALSNNINKLKYFNIQANIHMAKVAKFISLRNKNEITQAIYANKNNEQNRFFKDDRFTLNIQIIRETIRLNTTNVTNIIFAKIIYKDFQNVNVAIVREFEKVW